MPTESDASRQVYRADADERRSAKAIMRVRRLF